MGGGVVGGCCAQGAVAGGSRAEWDSWGAGGREGGG